MFFLIVKTKNKNFFKFIKEHSRSLDHDSYVFKSDDYAANLISKFILFYYIQLFVKKIISSRNLSDCKKNQIYAHISVEKKYEIFLLLKKDLIDFFKNSTLFDFEGYLNFRTKKISKEISFIVDDAFKFYENPSQNSNDIIYFRDIIKNSPTKVTNLISDVTTKSIDLYIDNEKVISFDISQQEDFISELILLSPKNISICDPNNFLKKENVIIIKQTFLKQVNFLDKPIKHYFNQ